MKAFEPTEIKSLNLKNRFVRSATMEKRADTEGRVTQELIDFTAALARGGAGLIITGVAYVQFNGKAYPNQIGIYKDDLIPGLKMMTDKVHEYDGKIAIQIAHAGSKADLKHIGETPLAPSIIEENIFRTHSREINLEEIDPIVESFGEAARRAKEAGFDAIQIHAAHGHLLHQFISPFTNRRNDAYGGNLGNRIRIVIEVSERIREEVGERFPTIIKMNVEDFIQGGIHLDESKIIAKKFSDVGIDAIEISGGFMGISSYPKHFSKREAEMDGGKAHFLKHAEVIKNLIDIPLIIVGGIRSLKLSERILQLGSADYISMCRPCRWS